MFTATVESAAQVRVNDGWLAATEKRLLIRMALHSVNTAVAAATDLEDEASILDAARTAARALTAAL